VTAAACDVPDIVKSCCNRFTDFGSMYARYALLDIDALMWPPGETSSGFTKPSYVGPVDENDASRSSAYLYGVLLSVSAPTVITYGTLPGTFTVIGSGPSLPADTTTTMPARHAAITAWFSGSSQ